MIKHIVMWKVGGETPDEHRHVCVFLIERFEGLAGLIPGLLKLEVGVDFSRIDYACDVVLYSEFDSQEALDAYASQTEHLRVKGELGSSSIARHQVDYLS
jgi:hypothetical protein